MKKKSLFSKILIIVIVAVVCLVLTLTVALLLGSSQTDIFDLTNLNISNMLPVILIGGFITCLVIGILILFLAKDVTEKIKNYLFNNNGGNEK